MRQMYEASGEGPFRDFLDAQEQHQVLDERYDSTFNRVQLALADKGVLFPNSADPTPAWMENDDSLVDHYKSIAYSQENELGRGLSPDEGRELIVAIGNQARQI